MATTTTSSTSSAESASTPAKGRLVLVDDESVYIDFHFNPKDLSLKKGYKWQVKTDEKKDQPEAEFQGADPGTMTLALLFDTLSKAKEGNAEDVRTYTDKIFLLAGNAEKTKDDSGAVHPGRVRLVWGSIEFEGVITSVDITFSLFSSAGVPLRASVTIGMTEQGMNKITGQNPTSRGIANLRLHRVTAGETLPSIAHLHYGKCERWREIATANDLNRIRRLPAGLELRIPNV